jgi:hypothetical protein
LGENERLLLASADHFRNVAQTRELAAVLLGPGGVAEPLGWMVKDLLQPHEQGEHDASALDSVDVFELASGALPRGAAPTMKT